MATADSGELQGALTIEEFGKFSAARRVAVDPQKLEGEALPDLLVAAAHLYEEVQKRKVAGTPPGAVQGGKPAARAGA